MKRYFSYMAIFLAMGIFLAHFFDMKNLATYILIFTLVIIAIIFGIVSDDDTIIKAVIFLFIGIALVLSVNNSKVYKALDSKSHILAKVIKVEEANDKQKLLVRIISLDEKKLIINNKILITSNSKNVFKEGNFIEGRILIEEAKHNKNPKMFNYKDYLLTKGIHGVAFVKDTQLHIVENRQSFIGRFREIFKKHVDKTFSNHMDMRNQKLLKSIVLGENYLVDDEREIYNALGLAHILAVSGLHIGLISSFIFIGLGFLKINKNLARIMTIVSIWIYASLIYFPVSIIRANIMISLYLLSKNLFLPYDYKNSIYLSILVLLILNPFNLFNISFILSFIAVLSIAYIEPAIESYLDRYKLEYSRLIASIISVNIGLFPVIAYYFNQVQVISLISNLLVVPVIVLGLNLACISLLVAGRISALNLLINTIFKLESFLVKLLGRLPLVGMEIFSPDLSHIIFYYMVIFICLYPYKFREIFRNYYRVIMVNMALYCLISLIDLGLLNKLEINFIDVGQGDFILIKDNNRHYIVDTGGEVFGDYSVGQNITLPYLLKHGVGDIKALFITHFHEDHCKAALDILDRHRVENIFVSHLAEGNYLYDEIIKNHPVKKLNTGHGLRLSDDLVIRVLSPEGNFRTKNENNYSLVLLLEYENIKVLFTGDMEREIENKLIEKQAEFLRDIDIIKAPHHGSRHHQPKIF